MNASPEPEDIHSLKHHLACYLAFLSERNYSSYTVDNWSRSANQFIAWCDDRSVTCLEDVSRSVIEGFQRHLFHYRKVNGEPLSVGSQHTKMIALQQWFRWLTRRGLMQFNPAADLEMPRRGVLLPKAILSAKETEAVLAMPDIQTPLGLRDRAMLETFYSSGIRRMELMNLDLPDVDFDRGALMVRQGKGRRDRLTPVGERALLWIDAYLDRVRPLLVRDVDDGALFLTYMGRRFSPMGLSRLTSRYVTQAGLRKRGSCHMFRHSMATLMLDNGADLRCVQELLGHARITSTQVYTHLSIGRLKAVHTATHPGRLPEGGQPGLEGTPLGGEPEEDRGAS